MKKSILIITFLVMAFFSTNVFCQGVVSDIKANGSDGPINIAASENLSIAIQLTPGDFSGDNADWWLVAATPLGLFHYQLYTGLFVSGLTYSHQGSLFNLGEFEVLNISGLPTGSYIFYFGVDMDMNGVLNIDQTHYDSLTVNVVDGGDNPNDVDDDGDGYTENEGDCNDSNVDINPGEIEICLDGIDQDCDGSDVACTPEPNDVAEQLWNIDVSFTGRSYSNEWSWENIKIAGSQEPLKTEYDPEYPFPYMHQHGGKTLVDTSFYDNTDGGLILAYYPEAYTYNSGLALIKKGYCIDLEDLIVGDEPNGMAGDTYFSCGDEAIAPTWDGIQTSLSVAQEAAYIKHEAFTLHDTGRWINDAGSSSLTITFTPVN